MAPFWGPLAVIDDPAIDVEDAGGGTGFLLIGRDCVTWRGDDDRSKTTLIWRSGQTRWDPSALDIVFRDVQLGVVRLATGSRITIGGAPLTDPSSPDQGAEHPRWLVPPDPSCPKRRWVIHQIVLPQP